MILSLSSGVLYEIKCEICVLYVIYFIFAHYTIWVRRSIRCRYVQAISAKK